MSKLTGPPADVDDTLLASLLDEAQLLPLEGLPDLVRKYAAAAGFREVTLFLADLEERQLAPMPTRDAAAAPTVSVDDTTAGRAFRALETVRTGTTGTSSEGDGRVFVPLLVGAERVGVLAATVKAFEEHAARRLERLASLVALFVVAKRPHSDTAAWLQRTRTMTVAAELQRRLLPPLTLGTSDLIVAGALEPAYQVGGDVFDYALSGDTAYLALFDSMGHDLSSGLAASVAVASWRRSRRLALTLPEAAAEIDTALIHQFQRQRFVTGVLATLNVRTGQLQRILRGHPPPLLLRGQQWASSPQAQPDPPMGHGLPTHGHTAQQRLQPGDRVLLHSDGVVDARSPDGEIFGLQRFTDFVLAQEAAQLAAPETLRRLMHAILDHHQGRLQDDSTVLLAEWRPSRWSEASL